MLFTARYSELLRVTGVLRAWYGRVTGALQCVTGVLQGITGELQRVMGMLQRVTGVLHRVTGALQRVTGVLRRVTGMLHHVTACYGHVTASSGPVIADELRPDPRRADSRPPGPVCSDSPVSVSPAHACASCAMTPLI